MERVSYELKRAHWAVNSLAMREFKKDLKAIPALEWMTPARYDIMHAIAERFWWERPAGKRSMPNATMPMGDLIRLLGLHPSTVSKMIKRMKVLKLVTTKRRENDERQVLISFAEAGWAAFREARKLFRQRPQHFLRAKYKEWFERLGMKDGRGSIRTAQCWAKSLASVCGVESEPIHDPRCDLGWEIATWWCQVFDLKRRKWGPPPPTVRRRAYS